MNYLPKLRSKTLFKKIHTKNYYTSYEDLKRAHSKLFINEPFTKDKPRVSMG